MVAEKVDVLVYNDAFWLFISVCIGYVFLWSWICMRETEIYLSDVVVFFYLFLSHCFPEHIIICTIYRLIECWCYYCWTCEKKEWKIENAERKIMQNSKAQPEKRQRLRWWCWKWRVVRIQKKKKEETTKIVHKWWKIATQTKTKTSDSCW